MSFVKVISHNFRPDDKDILPLGAYPTLIPFNPPVTIEYLKSPQNSTKHDWVTSHNKIFFAVKIDISIT